MLYDLKERALRGRLTLFHGSVSRRIPRHIGVCFTYDPKVAGVFARDGRTAERSVGERRRWPLVHEVMLSADGLRCAEVNPSQTLFARGDYPGDQPGDYPLLAAAGVDVIVYTDDVPPDLGERFLGEPVHPFETIRLVSKLAVSRVHHIRWWKL